MMEILTPEEVGLFHRDGYLKFRRVIEDEQIQRLRAELDRVIAEERTREDDADLPPEFAYGQDRRGQERPGARAIHQYVNIWKVVPAYREAIHNPRITATVRDLMAVPRIRIWHDQIISKPPGDNKHFNCHHDF